MYRVASLRSAVGMRSALRTATHDVHERLHRHPAFEALLVGTLTVSGYRNLLARLYGFHRPLEDELFRLPGRWWLHLDPEPRRRAHRLAEDLQVLGMEPREIAALPQAPTPAISDWPALLGCLYVREGATLGGRVLARTLEPLLGPTEIGRSFFTGDPRDSTSWAELCTTLDSVSDERHVEALIDAARNTFEALETWLRSDSLADERFSRP